jgi:hypothetical protein
MRTNRILKIAAFLFFVVLLASCEYEFIEVYKPVPPDSTDTIYFQAEIAPIFESSDCTDCHKAGGLGPFSLTAAEAYNSIMANNLAVSGEPDNSLIYTYPNPQTGTHHKYKSNTNANLIYGWIIQGALNN